MIKLTSSQILAFFARQCCKGSEGLTVSPNSQSKIEKNNGYVFNKKKDLDGCTSQLCYCRLYPGACSARQQVNECLDSCCRRHHLPPMLKNHHQHQCHHQRPQHCHHHHLFLFQRVTLRQQAPLESARVDAENVKIVVRLLKDSGMRLRLLYFKGCSRWN